MVKSKTTTATDLQRPRRIRLVFRAGSLVRSLCEEAESAAWNAFVVVMESLLSQREIYKPKGRIQPITLPVINMLSALITVTGTAGDVYVCGLPHDILLPRRKIVRIFLVKIIRKDMLEYSRTQGPKQLILRLEMGINVLRPMFAASMIS